MDRNLITRDELLARLGVTLEALRDWEQIKLLKPVGWTDDRVPLYSEALTERLSQVRRLQELGYKPEDIRKILKKVGLPGPGGAEDRPAPSEKYLTIGQLAERAELSPRTIKHWEDKGIIEPDLRTEGGFRLYSEIYVRLCELVKDLQLFGYALDEIKAIADDFREYQVLKDNPETRPKVEAEQKLERLLRGVGALSERMGLLKKGVERWEDLLKKQKKDILNLKHKNSKREDSPAEKVR